MPEFKFTSSIFIRICDYFSPHSQNTIWLCVDTEISMLNGASVGVSKIMRQILVSAARLVRNNSFLEHSLVEAYTLVKSCPCQYLCWFSSQCRYVPTQISWKSSGHTLGNWEFYFEKLLFWSKNRYYCNERVLPYTIQSRTVPDIWKCPRL